MRAAHREVGGDAEGGLGIPQQPQRPGREGQAAGAGKVALGPGRDGDGSARHGHRLPHHGGAVAQLQVLAGGGAVEPSAGREGYNIFSGFLVFFFETGGGDRVVTKGLYAPNPLADSQIDQP